jgi:hypothetical protein
MTLNACWYFDSELITTPDPNIVSYLRTTREACGRAQTYVSDALINNQL